MNGNGRKGVAYNKSSDTKRSVCASGNHLHSKRLHNWAKKKQQTGCSHLTRSACRREHRNGRKLACFLTPPTFTCSPGSHKVVPHDRRKSTGSNTPVQTWPLRKWCPIDNSFSGTTLSEECKCYNLSNTKRGKNCKLSMTGCKTVPEKQHACRSSRDCEHVSRNTTNTNAQHSEKTPKRIHVPKPFYLENSPSNHKLFIRFNVIPSSQTMPVVVLHDLFEKRDNRSVPNVVTVSDSSPNERMVTVFECSPHCPASVDSSSGDVSERQLPHLHTEPISERTSEEGRQNQASEQKKRISMEVKRLFSPKRRPLNSGEFSDSICSIL